MSASGIVVDEQGNPVAEAELSQFWLGGTSEPGGFRNFGAVKSNGLGQFSLQIDRKQLPATVFVMDSARHRGAILRIADTSSANNLRVELSGIINARTELNPRGAMTINSFLRDDAA